MSEASSLLNLQEIDLDILRSTKQVEEIPQGAEILKVKAHAKDLNKRLNKAVGMRKDLEMEISELDTARKETSAEVERVSESEEDTTDHRRVTERNRELSNLAKKLEKIDFEQNRLYEQLEKVESAESQIEDALKKLADLEAALVEEYRSVATDLKERLSDLATERAEEASRIGEVLLDIYEERRKLYGGVGVGRLEAGACTACRAAFEEGKLIRFRNGPAYTDCPSCKRILVVREQDDDVWTGEES